MRWKLWVIFGVAQCTGFIVLSKFLVPCVSNSAPIVLGLLLLFAGDLILFVLGK